MLRRSCGSKPLQHLLPRSLLTQQRRNLTTASFPASSFPFKHMEEEKSKGEAGLAASTAASRPALPSTAPPSNMIPKHDRPRLTDVEATALQVSLYRSTAATLLLRPDGLPYYDGSYDRALVDACLPPEEQARLLSRLPTMQSFMTIRTAEIDHQITQALRTAHPSGSNNDSNSDPSYSESASSICPGGSGSSGSGSGSSGSSSGIVRQLVLLGAGLDTRAWRLFSHAAEPEAGASLAAAAAAASAAAAAAGSTAEAAAVAKVAAGTKTEDAEGEAEGAEKAACEAVQEAGQAEAAASAAVEAVVVYELDSGSVESLKLRVLGRPRGCVRRFVRADLERPEQALAALTAAGHTPLLPSLVLAEGLIGYLSRQAGDALLTALHSACCPGSRLLLTVPPSPAWREQLAAQGATLHHVTYEEAWETLERVRSAGWDAQLLTAASLGAKYGLPDNRFELIVGCRTT